MFTWSVTDWSVDCLYVDILLWLTCVTMQILSSVEQLRRHVELRKQCSCIIYRRRERLGLRT